MNKKGKLTTLIAIIGLLIYASLYISAQLGWIDMEMFDLLEKRLLLAIPIAVAVAAKDANKSHSFKTGDHPPPDDEKPPGG